MARSVTYGQLAELWSGEIALLIATEGESHPPGTAALLLDGSEHRVQLNGSREAGSRIDRAELLDVVVDCPLCGERQAQVRFSVIQFFWQIPVVECGRCGLLYKKEVPRPPLLGCLYSDGYVHCRVDPPSEDELRALVPRVRRLGHPPGRHLDYGCGTGAFVAAASGAGWDSYGCDPYLPAIPETHPVCRRLCRAGPASLDDFGQFQAISIWAAVEHMTAPLAAFRALARCLETGGRLVFNCPNGASVVALRDGSRWAMALLLEHHIFMTPRSIQWLAGDTGLGVARIRKCGSPYPFGRSSASATAQGLRPAVLGGERASIRLRDPLQARETPARMGLAMVTSAVAAVGMSDRCSVWLRPVIEWLGIGDHIEATLVRHS